MELYERETPKWVFSVNIPKVLATAFFMEQLRGSF